MYGKKKEERKRALKNVYCGYFVCVDLLFSSLPYFLILMYLYILDHVFLCCRLYDAKPKCRSNHEEYIFFHEQSQS